MLKPEYLSKVPASMVELYSQAEIDILTDMARRISTYDYWIPAAEHQAKMLEEMGMVREEIITHLKGLTGKSQKELTSLMGEAAEVALKSDDAVYKRNGLNPGPVRASASLQKVLQSGYKKTQKLFDNLTLTTAKTASKQFENALNRAYMQISLGGMDYNSVIRSAVKELSKQGVGAVEYPSGKTDNLETAVRRATITGVNQMALKMQEARADEMGCDLVETSAHAGARPSHAEWQGEIFSRSGKSKKYPDFVQSTGYGKGDGLGGWNCSHSFSPYFEGSPRTYTKEQLAEYQEKSFKYNGQKMTEYEALGEQRNIERNIRRWKREQSALRAAGLPTDEAGAKIKSWQEREKDFLNQTRLKKQTDRSQIGGYSKREAQKTNWENRKLSENLVARSRKDDIIKLAKANKIKGKVSLDYHITDTTDFKFDDKHINAGRAHSVTKEEAQKFIVDSKVMLTRWEGQFQCYFGSEGATYIDLENKNIRTSFKREEYDPDTLKFMEGVEKLYD